MFNRKFFISFVTGLTIGAFIGFFILLILISYRIDEYHKRIVSLETIIEDKDIKLEKLESDIDSGYIALKDIEVNLVFDGDELDRIDIERTIKEKYTSLLGQNVKDMDADILSEVVDKRIFKIEEKEYRLKLEKLILSETLKLYIRVNLKE